MIDTHPAQVALFKALGDPTRHLIVQVLSNQELAVNELVGVLELPQSTVSRHLRVLREAGWVSDRREGTTVYCRAATATDGQDSIAGAIRQWFQGQPLPPDVGARVDGVLRRRRERSSEFFDRLAGEWDDLRRGTFGQQFALEAVLGLLPADWVAVDLGTGTGHLLGPLARAFRQVIAVDHSQPMLDRAAQRVRALGLDNVELRWGELEALPIEAGRVDLAIAMLVLHHAAQPGRTLSEIARVLRPGGTLLMVELAEHQDDALRQAMGDLWMGFAPSRLSSMADEAGIVTQRTMPLSDPGGEQDPTRETPSLFAMIARKDDAG